MTHPNIDQSHARGSGVFFGSGGEINNYDLGPAAATGPARTGTAPTEERVFVVSGRDSAARIAMFEFLLAIGLQPLEWEDLAATSGTGAPHVLQVVKHGFATAQAAVVLFTPDDCGQLHPDFHEPDDLWFERQPAGQPRQNVLFETGMAMALHENRTVVVQIGGIRPFTDLGGLDVIRLDGSVTKLKNIAERLRQAGCRVNSRGDLWMDVDRFAALAAMTRTP